MAADITTKVIVDRVTSREISKKDHSFPTMIPHAIKKHQDRTSIIEDRIREYSRSWELKEIKAAIKEDSEMMIEFNKMIALYNRITVNNNNSKASIRTIKVEDSLKGHLMWELLEEIRDRTMLIELVAVYQLKAESLKDNLL